MDSLTLILLKLISLPGQPSWHRWAGIPLCLQQGHLSLHTQPWAATWRVLLWPSTQTLHTVVLKYIPITFTILFTSCPKCVSQNKRQKRHNGHTNLGNAAWVIRLPRWASGKEPACQCRRRKRHRFNPWVREIPWRRAWQPTPVFLPGESHRQRSLVSYSPWGCRVGHNGSDWAHTRYMSYSHLGDSQPMKLWDIL